MSHSPRSPSYSSGSALERVSARIGRSSISRRGGARDDCTEVTYVPLPFDVDPAFSHPVTTRPKGRVGLRLKDCLNIEQEWAPNRVIMERVEGAEVKIDEGKMFPGGKVVVGRAYFPGETVQPPTQLVKDVRGLTWGHLLSLLVREQYRAAAQGEWPLAVAGESWQDGLPPYEHVWVVAIRRSNGADGTVRWFPELEVRIPFRELREGREYAA